MRIEFATADFNDWNALLQLLRSSFAYMDARIDPPSSLAAMTEDDLRRKAGRERLILAWHQGRLVGCAYADVRSDCVYVGKIAVDGQVRGSGVARQLLAAAESLAREAGRPTLQLQTRIELTENHATFGALGFVKVAETAHVGYGRPTSITMQRAVAAPPAQAASTWPVETRPRGPLDSTPLPSPPAWHGHSREQ